jgi:hypothetical protein
MFLIFPIWDSIVRKEKQQHTLQFLFLLQMREWALPKYSIPLSCYLFGSCNFWAKYYRQVDWAKNTCALTIHLFSCHDKSSEAQNEGGMAPSWKPVPYQENKKQILVAISPWNVRWSLILPYWWNHPGALSNAQLSLCGVNMRLTGPVWLDFQQGSLSSHMFTVWLCIFHHTFSYGLLSNKGAILNLNARSPCWQAKWWSQQVKNLVWGVLWVEMHTTPQTKVSKTCECDFIWKQGLCRWSS